MITDGDQAQRRRRRLRHLLRRRPVGDRPGDAAARRPRARPTPSSSVEQEEATRRAVAEERATIARELHDVVAHAISVTVLQSRGARRMLGRDEEQVRRALDAIEHTNTQALGDMRRLLAVLRDTEGDAATDAAAVAGPARRPGRRRARLRAGRRARRGRRGPRRTARRRPVGVPDRPGGAHQRAQARRGRARRRCGWTTAPTSSRLSVRDDGVGDAAVERHRPRAGRASASGSRSSAARSRPARPPAAASRSAPGCPTPWRTS